MAYSALTQPHTYMNGYSFIPLRLDDNNSQTVENYKYIVNITFNGLEVLTSQAYSYDGDIYTKLTFSSDHEYKIGDIILMDDASNYYSGYYIVVLVPSSDSVVIDLTLGPALTATTNTYNVIKYKVNPDPDYEAKLDLSNTLKDYVTQNLSDSNEIYEGTNTRFDYDLKLGYEGNALYTFHDNAFQSGYAGFVNSGFTATTQVDFEVGDVIQIQQDLYEWEYDDNFFDSGYVGFTGSTPQYFASGDTATITGQITNPSYNGPTTIRESADTYSIIIEKSFLNSSPAEGGTIYGVITPEYNVTATITDIVYSAGTGVIVTTDIPFAQSTPPIGGTIKHADGRFITSFDDLAITGLSVYNSYVNQYNYSITDFDKYVCQNRAAASNNISTILGNTDRYRIEPSSKSWLLAHADGTNYWTPVFSFYNAAGSLISKFRIPFTYEYGPQVDIGSYADNGGNLRLNCSAVHNLSVGDVIEIFQAPAAYTGITTVLSVQSTVAVTVDVTYTGAAALGAEYLKKITGGTYDDYYFPVGMDQLTANTSVELISGSALSAVTSSVDYYKVELEKNGTANTNPIYFEINEDCSRYELYHLMWKDARGSWISYPFKYLSRDKTEVDKKNYYQTDGNWSNNTFDFDSFGRGSRTYFSRSRDSVKLNSGWISAYENALMKDLMQSAAVYIQTPDNVLFAATIDDKKIEFGKGINDGVWQYTFEVVYSNDEIRL